MALLMILKNEKLFNTDNTMDIEIKITIPQVLKVGKELTGKILKVQRVDQAHHLIVVVAATLQDLVVDQVVVEDGKKNVGATPRGCPSHGRLQGAAPTVCKIYFIRSETK